jgi:hypothetical protein
MFKAIKEFFVGKPKVEEAPPAECPYKAEIVPAGTEATMVAPAPVVEEIKPETVTISISDNMNVSVGTQSDTITLSPPADPGAWPFPNTPPAETEVKKKRTFVKREEAVTEKKLTPAIKATKTKPRKKK